MRTLVLLLTLIGTSAFSDELRILNWNIANLAADVGVSLPDGSHQRTEDDYLRIREIVARANPDIVTLQEIGSIAAAEKVLGPNYTVHLESRCSDEICATDHGDIYTAIAHKVGLPVVDLAPLPLDDLSILHVSERGGPGRFVRGGIGLSFTRDDVPMVIMSVHLKASCADEDANDADAWPDTQDDCAVLDQQILVLRDWMSGMVADGKTVIVGGDYNRKFLEPGDRQMATLRAGLPEIRVEPSVDSQCWPKDHPQSRNFRTRKLYERLCQVIVVQARLGANGSTQLASSAA